MSRQTQKQMVMEQLDAVGQVSRNWCLSKYVSRLASIIATLKKEGYAFDTREVVGAGHKDYMYIWTNK